MFTFLCVQGCHYDSSCTFFRLMNAGVCMQITFFSGIMCVDKARQERRKFDVALCFTSKGEEHAGYCCGLFKGHKDGWAHLLSR